MESCRNSNTAVRRREPSSAASATAPSPSAPTPSAPRPRSAALAAVALAASLLWQPSAAAAANGDCAQPSSNGSGPTATDCLFILRVAVGINTCSPECICAPKGTLPTKASDALLCLRKSVGQGVTLDCPCSDLPDGDDFNDNSIDPARWSDEFVNGNGVLEETGGVLEYTCDVATEYDQSLRDWVASLLPYSADWEVRVDVTNLTVPNMNDQLNSFGISVVDSEFFGNEVFAELYASRFGGPPARNGFYAALYEDENFLAEVDTNGLPVTAGAVRIAFDAGTRVLRAYYDIDPGNGYTWVEFASFGVDGSGGDDDNADWNMTDGDTFLVSLYGYSSNIVVPAGKIFGDNFLVTGGVPVP